MVDYGRFVIARFWGDASPDSFEKRAGNPNTTLVNRDMAAAFAFVERLERSMVLLEL